MPILGPMLIFTTLIQRRQDRFEATQSIVQECRPDVALAAWKPCVRVRVRSPGRDMASAVVLCGLGALGLGALQEAWDTAPRTVVIIRLRAGEEHSRVEEGAWMWVGEQ